MLSANKKLSHWILSLALGSGLIYGISELYGPYEAHRYRILESRYFESMLVEKLTSEKEVKLEEIIPIGEQVCFLPSYMTPEQVDSYLSKNQLDFLNARISDDVENHWWVIVLSKEEVLKTYRMAGDVIPIFREGRCVRRKNSIKLVFFDIDKYRHTPHFDIQKEMPWMYTGTQK
ncbi:hypothetical protein [Verminephrobacter aporrectodeae]|uniref:hypothetical protein n=1 Tax=Verminephrobacter aporrectodeae TaxID=1110389 RepID=UPI0002F2A1BE|nr:hypothetical protein [Verminephrobacter aporrectodeae]